MNARIISGLSLTGLAAAYCIIRYPLYPLHGMKGWTLCLFLAGAAIICGSGIALKRKVLPVMTVAGYMAGFLAGWLFRSDYGTEWNPRNNMWIIWTCVYLAVILAGCLIERKKN